MHRAPRILAVHAALLVALLAGNAHAADPNGVPLCTAASDQTLPVTVSDGVGGIIVAWHDGRPTAAAGGVCYAQRLSAAGVPQWTADGVALSTTGDPVTPVIAADGAGGAFVAYGGTTAQPRVQHVNASGVPQWGADGVQLTNSAVTMRDLAIATDIGGTGGAFVAWRLDNGAGGTSDVYAQKVNSSGVIQWGLAGIPVAATNMNNEGNPAVLSDGVGGAFIVFIGGQGVRIQRFNATGASVWSQVTLASMGNNMPPAMVSDGAGGAVVAWAGGGAFVQRVTSGGSRDWGLTLGGVTLSTTARAPSMIPDGAGGAIVAWEDNRTPTNFNIYAQKLSNTGAPQWISNGSPVCTATQDQRLPVIVSDGSGGAIIAWYDARMSPLSGTDIYAQRIDGTGAPQWTLDGVSLCAAPNNQDIPTIASDGAGGAWVAWQDLRSGTNEDVYAARVNPSGGIVSVPPERERSIARVWPDPFSDRVAMEFALPAPARVNMKVYDLRGRVVADLGRATLPQGIHRLTWDGRASGGLPVPGGLYFLRVEGPGIALSRSVVRLK